MTKAKLLTYLINNLDHHQIEEVLDGCFLMPQNIIASILQATEERGPLSAINVAAWLAGNTPQN